MELYQVVVFTVGIALLFDAINGFHDAANSIATVISTRVLSPRAAVLWAAFFNFLALVVFRPHVANTISKVVIIKPLDAAFVYVVLAGLLGAILWDLLTWVWALPTSSSHALVGGVAGAGLAHGGLKALHWPMLATIVEFIFVAPFLGFLFGYLAMFGFSWALRKQRPMWIDNTFRKLQLISAAIYSVGHGGNDAQKTMGIIVALLLASGHLEAETLQHEIPWWIAFSCNLAMALGTAFGGMRVVRTMGMRITKLQPLGGFCSELSGSLTLLGSTIWGIPVSTTHTIAGAIIGVGSARNLSRIHWGVAKSIVWAWIFTIPAAAGLSASCYFVLAWLAQLPS